MGERGIDELRAALSGGATVGDLSITDLCRRCLEVLGVAGATITLSSERFGEERVAAFDSNAGEVEDLQFTMGEGPGVDASRTGIAVFCESLEDCRVRWPHFVPAALTKGLHGAFAMPLRVGAIGLGVLVLYFESKSVSTATLAEARIIADVITETLLAQQAVANAQGITPPVVTEGLHSAVLQQAVGMVSVQLDCSIDEALIRLRAYAYSHEQMINDVARKVVGRHLRFTDEGDF